MIIGAVEPINFWVTIKCRSCEMEFDRKNLFVGHMTQMHGAEVGKVELAYDFLAIESMKNN